MSENTRVRMTISYVEGLGQFAKGSAEFDSFGEAIKLKGQLPSPETHSGFIENMEGERTHRIVGENVIEL